MQHVAAVHEGENNRPCQECGIKNNIGENYGKCFSRKNDLHQHVGVDVAVRALDVPPQAIDVEVNVAVCTLDVLNEASS